MTCAPDDQHKEETSNKEGYYAQHGSYTADSSWSILLKGSDGISPQGP